jgi:hypothetical protein
VEFVAQIEQPRTFASQVALSASVTFQFTPLETAAFERARILDGPVTLVQAEPGSYLVFDLQRDGVPMSDGIQLFEDQLLEDGEARVLMDSLFMFPPNWQFNVVVRNDGGTPLVADPSAIGLYVDGPGGFQRVEGVLSESLEVIQPGATVDGLVAFPLQDSAAGRVLTLVYGSGRKTLQFDFPLASLVELVPPPPPGDLPAGVTG